MSNILLYNTTALQIFIAIDLYIDHLLNKNMKKKTNEKTKKTTTTSTKQKQQITAKKETNTRQ